MQDMQKKLLWYSWYGKGLDSKALKRNVNLWDCKRPNGSKWHIRLGMIGSASLRNMFSMNRPTAWTDELALLSSKSYVCVFSHLPCKKLHGIRKPAPFKNLVTTASSHQSLSRIWPMARCCLGKIVWEFDERWIHLWTNIGIKQTVARFWSLTISKVISPERIVAMCEPYVAMFISNLITL